MSTAKCLKKTPIAAMMPVILGCLYAQSVTAQLSVPPPPIKTYIGDPGTIGSPSTWRTAEFLRDWGLTSIGAEYAYAAGYSGAEMNIGVVDSGYFLGHMREHGSLDTNYQVGDRFFSVTAEGGTTGPTPGFYNQTYNDSHGTHVSGTVGASREGVGQDQPTGPVANMHGVAFNVDVYNGNTHKTDGVYYGLRPANADVAHTLDNGYIAAVYKAINATTGVDGKPVRVITSSWGSQPPTENYNTYDPPPNPTPAQLGFGINTSWRYLYTPDGTPDANGNLEHWINGAIEVARTGTILQFTAGNGGYQYTTARASAPYFLPELEGRWYTTSGISTTGRTFNADGSIIVPGQQLYNQCGLAKWSCVTAPGQSINSTIVQVVSGVPTARYGSSSGTSMAGPHSAASLALIMKRFPYMTNEQALYTMFTTGRQNNTINAPGTSTPAIPNPTAGQMVQAPDNRNGWNSVSLRDAFKGPGQLLGPVNLDTHGYSDVWSNDISEVAIKARQLEDAAEAATWAATLVAKGWTNGLPADATDADKSDYAIGLRREAARNARVYTGSLTKNGNGTLYLTGNETWQGGSIVNGGKLSVIGKHASHIDVNGGTLGGTGSVGDGINVITGLLWPGLSPAEAATIKDVPVVTGNVLTANAPVHIGHRAGFASTIRSNTDYTSVVTSSNVILDGALYLDITGAPTSGTVLTIMRGKKIVGAFDGLPEGGTLIASGKTFRISYLNNRVTLTVV